MRLEPEKAYALFLEKREPISDEEFFNDPAHQWLRDLWVGAHFGRAYDQFIGCCTVEFDWAKAHEWDFVLHTEAQPEPFQTTEALEPGRRRGLEYKQIESGERPRTTLESWEPGTRHGSEWINCAIGRKKNKNYAGAENLNLLVYANFPAYQLELSAVKVACRELASAFLSVWVITGRHLGLIHSASPPNQAVESGWLVINQTPVI